MMFQACRSHSSKENVTAVEKQDIVLLLDRDGVIRASCEFSEITDD